MSEVTCWTLLRGAAAGDERSRAEFARRYLPVARAYLVARWRERASEEELDDALQEVFLECLREDGVLERLGAGARVGFRAVLYGVVRNVARRTEAAAAQRRRGPAELPDLPADDPSLSRAFDRAWALSAVRAAARRMAQRARHQGGDALRRVELLELRFHSDLPIREIARRWEADPAWLHHEYARARREFEAELREVVAESDPERRGDRRAECLELLDLLDGGS